jgi:endonuclease III
MSTNPHLAALYRVQGRSNRMFIARHPQYFSVTFHYDFLSLIMVLLAAKTVDKDFYRLFLITRIVGFYFL